MWLNFKPPENVCSFLLKYATQLKINPTMENSIRVRRLDMVSYIHLNSIIYLHHWRYNLYKYHKKTLNFYHTLWYLFLYFVILSAPCVWKTINQRDYHTVGMDPSGTCFSQFWGLKTGISFGCVWLGGYIKNIIVTRIKNNKKL